MSFEGFCRYLLDKENFALSKDNESQSRDVGFKWIPVTFAAMSFFGHGYDGLIPGLKPLTKLAKWSDDYSNFENDMKTFPNFQIVSTLRDYLKAQVSCVKIYT